MYLLDKIHGHADLAQLDDKQRFILCQEIREFLVSSLSKTGGHLASNLGVVELSVALETVYNTAIDRLVFDVGHQSYVHKLLTGRQTDFAHLRQFGGIAGFPKPAESVTDAFVAGHSSSSVSIALGMARARTLTKQDYQVVALLGDGAATGGMIYEALNDAAVSGEPIVVVLNDNGMSIDWNVGGMAKHLSSLRSKAEYISMKQRIKHAIAKFPGGQGLYHIIRNVKDWLKRVLLPTSIFENMGMEYLGPVDGHDLPRLISLLRSAKDMKKPVLVHVITQKGRGYLPAEEHPSKFHGVGKYDPVTGDVLSKGTYTYSDAFGDQMIRLAGDNPRVCAITAAMPGGTGLLKFKQQFPDRAFDVGIAEEHAMSMAGGLAKQGMIPVIALYSTFLQRSYDMILQDIAMLGLHVVIAVDRAGLVGEDGETHHGVFDVGFLRQIPNLRLLAPGNVCELQDMLSWAVNFYDGPVAIRYPRGGDGSYTQSAWNQGATGVYRHRAGKHVTLITYGAMLDNVLAAADILHKSGVEATILRLQSLAPLPVDEILTLMSEDKRVVIAEETCTGSGIREALSWELQHRLPDCTVDGIDLGSQYITHGSIAQLYRHYGLDGEAISKFTLEVLQK